MKRFALSFAVVFAALMGTGCGRYFIKKDAYNAVKKAALVQYAVNPHMLLGTPSADDVRNGTPERNVASFIKEMNGKPYQLVPTAEMIANPGYVTAPDKLEGYHTAKGMRFFGDSTAAQEASLTPEQAKKLCADLGVDAVIAVYESWGQVSRAMGFKAAVRSYFFVNMYDKNGTRIWGDLVSGESEESVAAPGGVFATDPESMMGLFNAAFVTATKELSAHLGK
jgi:hypothetical protein